MTKYPVKCNECGYETKRLGNPKKLKFKLGQKGGITVSVGDNK